MCSAEVKKERKQGITTCTFIVLCFLGFDDVLTALEKLSSMTFFLPEDLAIRHLLKNTNEFGDA